jgi:hypothetical protein
MQVPTRSVSLIRQGWNTFLGQMYIRAIIKEALTFEIHMHTD